MTIFGKRRAANEIPASHNDPQLHAHFCDFNALLGDPLEFVGFNSEPAFVAESFA